MSDLINTLLNDRYLIVRRLGSGGMGSVYAGRDQKLLRDVAIKAMHANLAENQDFQARFQQEATTAAQFHHPGIVQVFDYGLSSGLLYIVMELIPGENLHQMLDGMRKQQQWIALREAVELVRQVSLALGYTHRRGVLHRDLKPANIMIKDEVQETLPYRPVIADFGLAKPSDGGVHTQTGIAMGTPSYMSPEQTLGDEQLDGRSDIYSLGVILYELAAGRPPLVAKSLGQAVKYHVSAERPRPSQFCPSIPPEVETIILKAIEKRPEDRYATAEEFASALEAVRGLASAESVPPTAVRGAVSIGTLVQEGMSLANATVQTQPFLPQLSEPHITVRAPDGTVRAVPIKSKRMKLGRNDDNDIVLEDDRVSRYHVEVGFDGLKAWVTDLESTNGSYLDNERLPARTRTPWAEGQSLRIGSHQLYVQLATDMRRPVGGPSGKGMGTQPDSHTTMVPPPPPVRRRSGLWITALIALLALVALGSVWFGYGRPNLVLRLQQLVASGPVSPGVTAEEATPSSTPQLAAASSSSDGVGQPATPGTASGTGSAADGAASTPTATDDATLTAAAMQEATATAQAVAVATMVAATLQVFDVTKTAEAVVAASATSAAATQTAAVLATQTAVAQQEAAAAELAAAVAKIKADADATAIALSATAQAIAATQTAAAIPTPTFTPTPLPPTNTPVPPTPVPPPPTNTPLPPLPPAQPGLVTSFEPFGNWSMGNEPWGTFVQSSAESTAGSFSGKLTYDFTSATRDNDYVVFMPEPQLPIQGQPQGLRMQVYGDGSRNFLMAWVRDSSGTTWQFTFGRIAHRGWGQMSSPFNLALGWPNGIVSGGGTSPTYPLSLEALVLNGEDHTVLTGEIYLDEMVATADTPGNPNVGSGGASAPAANPAGGTANEANISCGADPPVISAGQQATLFWTITGVRAVYLGNEGVAGIDKRTVSPGQTTTYTLRVVRTDGSETTCTMTIQVN